MAIVQWNRRYITRIGLPSETAGHPATSIRLKPGANELDDATLQRLRSAPAFERLQKDGAISAGSRGARPEGSRTEGTRALTSETVGDVRPALQGNVKSWDPAMSRRDLADALESRGVQSDAMTKPQLVEALRAYDEDQNKR